MGNSERVIGLALSAGSAVLLFVAGEPFGFGPLAWVALVPLLVAVLRAPKARWAWAFGLAFGLVYFGVHLSWIFLFGWMAWSALTIVLAAYVSIGTLVAGLVRKTALAPMLIAGAWVGAELLRDRWPFGGYSWGSVGTTQGSVPGVRWLAGVVGVYGLSFLVVFFSALIATRIVDARIEWRSAAVVMLGLLAFVALDVVAYGPPAPGRPVRTAVVQGNAPRPPRAGQHDIIFRSHMELSRDLLGREGPVDLIVWPESSVPGDLSVKESEALRALAVDSKASLLVGRSYTTEDSYLNLQQHISPDGGPVQAYSKRHPVPFGEYVPLAFLRRFVTTLQSEIPVDQDPGTDVTVFDVEGSKVATPICFESVFPRDFLDFARAGADLYVLSTNNTSFERSYASQQHVAHTRMRALETRQWVVQVALAGISASIAPDGEISNTTGLFERSGFVVTVRARPPSSLYARTGDVFPMMFAVITAVALALETLRRRRTSELIRSAA